MLNPHAKYYAKLKETMASVYEDVFWSQDVIFLERNSRDFIPRIHRININTEAVCEVLRASEHGIHPQDPSLLTSAYGVVKKVFYPKLNPSRANYDAFRTAEGGYGGLLSIVFHNDAHAIIFYDAIETAKGPSLGTNFTLTSPYTILAHYTEMDWAEKYGVERGLVRISVGLEEKERLIEIFESALDAVRKSEGKGGE